jgi:hypothetical protein
MHHWDGVFGAWRREFPKGAFTVDGLFPCFFFSIDHGVSLACPTSSSPSSFLFVHTLASREGRRLLYSLFSAVLKVEATQIIDFYPQSPSLSQISPKHLVHI